MDALSRPTCSVSMHISACVNVSGVSAPHGLSPIEPAAVSASDPGALTAAGSLLKALAAPVRLAVVLELRQGPRCVHELVEAVGAPQPLVSQHLRVLRGAGLVTSERRGREIAYSLTDTHVAHIASDAVQHAQEEP